eukprot:m.378607 g.378607  ORF g.378607 m.378607 type:complete len:66 (-) comp20934_c0_seq6:164-361(-)
MCNAETQSQFENAKTNKQETKRVLASSITEAWSFTDLERLASENANSVNIFREGDMKLNSEIRTG